VVQSNAENFLLKFGKNLRRIRKKCGFTQANLASDLNIDISQISRIERGLINTSVYTIFRIAKALKVNISELFKFD